MYRQTIPRYSCIRGVWEPNFGNSPSFTKNDVKEIRKDEKKMCVIIKLKDGTKINPEFVSASDEDILNRWYNKWILDVQHLKKALPPKQKSRGRYFVYDLYGRYVDETSAVSEAQAINNVRHNWVGDVPSNDEFFSIRVDHFGNEAEADRMFWYAVEFSIANNGEVGFNQAHAFYEIIKGESELDVKRSVEYEYFKTTDDRCIFVNVYFGRIKEFVSEKDALTCAKEWNFNN